MRTIVVLVSLVTVFFAIGKARGDMTIPPGYAFHQGILWNYKVCEAGITKAKELGHVPICITKMKDGSMYHIEEGFKISKVDDDTDYDEGVMLIAACDCEIKVDGVVLREGEHAVRRNGEFVKSSEHRGTDRRVSHSERERADTQDPFRRMAHQLARGVGKLSDKHVAVLPFAYSGVDSGEAEALTARLTAEMKKQSGLTLVDKGLVNQKLSKLKRKAFSSVGPKTASWLRKNLRVGGVVVGGIGSTADGKVEVIARLMDLSSRRIASSATALVPPEALAGQALRTSQPKPQKKPHRITDDVLRLKGPARFARLWKKLRKKYRMYVHRESGIRTFSDLSGRPLYCAIINVSLDKIVDDASKFIKSGAQDMALTLQNNPEVYGANLLNDSHSVGFMVPSVAKHYRFEDEADLVRVVIE